MSIATQPEQVIATRLEEVRAQLTGYQDLVDEERRLAAALAALTGESPFIAPQDTSPAANRERRGDRTQKEMVLHLIGEQPGIRTRDIRKVTNFGPSLNTLLSRLKAAGDIVKVEDGWNLTVARPLED
jgi:hypothetical protein